MIMLIGDNIRRLSEQNCLDLFIAIYLSGPQGGRVDGVWFWNCFGGMFFFLTTAAMAVLASRKKKGWHKTCPMYICIYLYKAPVAVYRKNGTWPYVGQQQSQTLMPCTECGAPFSIAISASYASTVVHIAALPC